ncbi:hypothetical protein [Streptomyces griseomycini]|uniref:hypothetical protein n=1 Tax=Streptomyces griseomycini TaxID=66895 RepID=UPI001876794D|nr:hypothetical protein [Streptomyces griseomycini]
MKAEVRPNAFVDHDIAAGRRGRDGGVAGAGRELPSEAVGVGQTAAVAHRAARRSTASSYAQFTIRTSRRAFVVPGFK